jgi:hypothetical protein
MNKGIDSRVMLAISSYTFWVTVSKEDAGMKKIIKITATDPNENAIGIPENIINSVTIANNIPRARIDIINYPSLA